MKAFCLATLATLVWSPPILAQPAVESSPAEQGLRQCGAMWDDFFWTHDIDGTVFIHVLDGTEDRLGPERMHCVEAWSIAAGRYQFLWPDGRNADRDMISAKAAACGLDPHRDIGWPAQRDGSVRAIILPRGATFRQFDCLIRWADLTGAPVEFAASTPDSD